MKHIEHSSYEEDDREFFSQFLDILSEKNRSSNKNKGVASNQRVQIKLTNSCDYIFNNMALNSLYYLGGYIISKIKKKGNICDICISAVGSTDAIVFPYADLTRTRCFKEQTLFFFLMKQRFIFFYKWKKFSGIIILKFVQNKK